MSDSLIYQFEDGGKADNGKALLRTLSIDEAHGPAVVTIAVSGLQAGRPIGAGIELDREDALKVHARLGKLLGL